MKHIYIAIIAGSILGVALADGPKFITPEMTLRRGLTDAQYEALWKQGRHPRIDPSAARDWIYRASRYQNATNWMEIIGRTNDAVKAAIVIERDNQVLIDTNAVLNIEVVRERGRAKRYKELAEEYEADSKEYRKAVKAAEKAAKKDSKNFEKWVKDTEKARDKSSEDMAEFYDAILEIALGTVPNGEAK